MPTDLSQAMADLLLSDSTRTRRRAARQVLRHDPRESVPEFLVALAELERGRNCNTRREQVERLERLGDARALPALERLDASEDCRHRTRGGLFGRGAVCDYCDEVSSAVETLRGQM